MPLFNPHDLRHRRVSLLHLRGVPRARIGEFVGQKNLLVSAETYTHVLVDERELDYGALLRGVIAIKRARLPDADPARTRDRRDSRR